MNDVRLRVRVALVCVVAAATCADYACQHKRMPAKVDVQKAEASETRSALQPGVVAIPDILARARADWLAAGLKDEDCSRLSEAAEVILRSQMTYDFGMYNDWMRAHGGSLGAVARANADQRRENSFKVIPDSEWDSATLEQKWRLIWSRPELRRGEWVGIDLSRTGAGAGSFEQEQLSWPGSQRMRGNSIFAYPRAIELNNAAVVDGARFAWLRIAASFRVRTDMLAERDKAPLAKKSYTDPIGICYAFVFDAQTKRWMPWWVGVEMKPGWPLLKV